MLKWTRKSWSRVLAPCWEWRKVFWLHNAGLKVAPSNWRMKTRMLSWLEDDMSEWRNTESLTPGWVVCLSLCCCLCFAIWAAEMPSVSYESVSDTCMLALSGWVVFGLKSELWVRAVDCNQFWGILLVALQYFRWLNGMGMPRVGKKCSSYLFWRSL